MKKLLALVLALIMVLGLGVTAFAANIITLTEDEEDDDVKTVEVLALEGNELWVAGKGGEYYVEVEDADDIEDLKVEATGCVSAKIVKFDPEDDTVDFKGLNKAIYAVKVLKDAKSKAAGMHSDKKAGEIWCYDFDGAEAKKTNITDVHDWTKVTGDAEYSNTYAEAKAVRAYLKENYDTDKFVIVCKEVPTLLRITVEDNYTAAYKEGKLVLTGKTEDPDDSKKTINVKAEIKVVRDVAIFGYEDVKEAAKYGVELNRTEYKGYSDYMSAKNGYKTSDLVLDMTDPEVISTTAFRAIEGKDITVVAGDEVKFVTKRGREVHGDGNVAVTISKVAAGQKGVNFTFGVDTDFDDDNNKHNSFSFGFKGQQVIESDYKIEMDLEGISWFDVREAFKQKLEEEDAVSFYVLKDGKLFDTIVVDYGKLTATIDGKVEKIDDIDDDIELTINGKAGTTLGWYTVQLTAPAADEAEENPNTGAESVVSVVAALAVVAVASAAAVSLKK